MNRTSFALFVALLIHLLIFFLIWWFLSLVPANTQHAKRNEHKIKISLKELPKKYKKSGLSKKKIKPPKIHQPMPKGSQLKKFIKPRPQKKKVHLNKPTLAKKTPTKPQVKTQNIPLKKPYIPLLPPKKQKHKKQTQTFKPKQNNPMSWLYEDKSKEEKPKHLQHATQRSNIAQDIQKLYGEEFGKLTPGQQQYILDNQEIMRRITQQILNRVARVNIPRDLRVNRSNVIEFYLHPNGDMTDFRFLSKSGYYILDDTTKETIEYAYSRYPRPKETTLIRYNVYYNLAY